MKNNRMVSSLQINARSISQTHVFFFVLSFKQNQLALD